MSAAAEPLHLRIAADLEREVREGRPAPGQRLAPERALAARLGVSRTTVRQALAELVERGLVRRRVGRGGGTFVQERLVERRPTSVAGLSEELRRQGMAAGARLVEVVERAATEEEARRLGLEPGAAVTEIVRVRLADGRPLAVEGSLFPSALVPGLARHDLTGSLYGLLRSVYGVVPTRAVEHLEPALAGTADARALGVRRGAPLMLVERVAMDAAGAPVELARDRFRGDLTRIVIETTEVRR